MRAATAGPPAGVPVTPESDEARRWAEDELARGIYTERTGLLERLLDLLFEFLDRLSELGESGAGWVLPTVVVVVTAIAVLVGLVVGLPRFRRKEQRDAGVLTDETRAAQELRAAADAAAARGDYEAAVLDRFRGLVRALADRALVEERPGLTADEAMAEASPRLPTVADELARAARLFDGVRYGRATTGSDDDGWLRGLDARVEHTRPLPPAAPAGAEALDEKVTA